MKKFLSFAFAAFLLLPLLSAGCAKANPEAEKAAVTCADAWLSLIDSGKYGESWDQSSAIFQTAITRETWEKALSGLRTPFGRVLSRKISKAKYYTSLPGAPDGHYVVIQYKTSFENKTSSVETITPMLEKDGAWRVSGYYIK